VRTLSTVRFTDRNVLVVALAVGVGLLPTVSPTIYERFPSWFTIVFDSGISAGAIVAITLNLLLGGERGARGGRSATEGPSAHDAVRGAQLAADPAGAHDAARDSPVTRRRGPGRAGGPTWRGTPARGGSTRPCARR